MKSLAIEKRTVTITFELEEAINLFSILNAVNQEYRNLDREVLNHVSAQEVSDLFRCVANSLKPIKEG
jgi:hypothetical protein